jgi:hypothetical protein
LPAGGVRACYTPRVPAWLTYDLFRRRIAPVAFVLALGFIGWDTCKTHERTHATIVLDLGVAERDVRAIEAEIWMNGEQVTEFRREAPEGAFIGAARFQTSLPDTEGEVRIDADLASGKRVHMTRTLHLDEGATVTIRLEHDLIDSSPK